MILLIFISSGRDWVDSSYLVARRKQTHVWNLIVFAHYPTVWFVLSDYSLIINSGRNRLIFTKFTYNGHTAWEIQSAIRSAKSRRNTHVIKNCSVNLDQGHENLRTTISFRCQSSSICWKWRFRTYEQNRESKLERYHNIKLLITSIYWFTLKLLKEVATNSNNVSFIF